MPHASARDGTRCAGREVWNWRTRAGQCNRCGAHEPAALPKFVACNHPGMVIGTFCVLAKGHEPKAHLPMPRCKRSR